jgi:RHS repeat-associated protein
MTSTTDRDGRVRNFTYDNANRQTGETWIVSGSTANLLTFTYDAAGNQLTAANYAGAYTMTYDALSRVGTEQEPFGLTLTFTYDGVSNRTLVQDSQGGVTTSIYDGANNLKSRQFGGTGQTPLRVDLTYTARNQIAGITRYSDLGGTQTVAYSAYSYDAAERLTNIQHQNASGGMLANYTYTYDQASRLTSQVVNGSTTSYGYDTTNELTSDGSNNYSFDMTGNRTMSGYQTGTANELKNDGTWTCTYDNEGNVTGKVNASGETWSYGYDNLNRMTWAKDVAGDGVTTLTLATYVYDARGNRIEKDVWTKSSNVTTVYRFAYDGQNVWARLSGTNVLQARYLQGDAVDQLFARINAGTAGWYLTDWQGSVRNIIDNSANLLDTISYDGFGNATESNPGVGDRYKFGGQFDSETGLQYNRARYYDAKAGRWTSQDPLGFAAGDSNLYRYVGNSPTNATDPSGLRWWDNKLRNEPQDPTQPASSSGAVTTPRLPGQPGTPAQTPNAPAGQMGNAAAEQPTPQLGPTWIQQLNPDSFHVPFGQSLCGPWPVDPRFASRPQLDPLNRLMLRPLKVYALGQLRAQSSPTFHPGPSTDASIDWDKFSWTIVSNFNPFDWSESFNLASQQLDGAAFYAAPPLGFQYFVPPPGYYYDPAHVYSDDAPLIIAASFGLWGMGTPPVEGLSGGVLDNYVESNGFKFTEYYYDRLWTQGRAAPGFRAESILKGMVGPPAPDPLGFPGFFRYAYDGWEMIYNPTTGVVSHLGKMK